MKKLFVITTLFCILASCKTSKANCDAYSSYEAQKDSTIGKVGNYHIENEQYSFYLMDTVD